MSNVDRISNNENKSESSVERKKANLKIKEYVLPNEALQTYLKEDIRPKSTTTQNGKLNRDFVIADLTEKQEGLNSSMSRAAKFIKKSEDLSQDHNHPLLLLDQSQ
jgi:hypothetical protein